MPENFVRYGKSSNWRLAYQMKYLISEYLSCLTLLSFEHFYKNKIFKNINHGIGDAFLQTYSKDDPPGKNIDTDIRIFEYSNAYSDIRRLTLYQTVYSMTN